MDDMACQKNLKNLDSLKRSLVKAESEILLETVRAAISEWLEGLKACVESESGHLSDIITRVIPKSTSDWLVKINALS